VRNVLSVLLLLTLLIGCKKQTPSNVAVSGTFTSKAPGASGGAKSSTSGPSAIMTTQFPGSDRLVLAWSLTGCKHVRVDFAGQTVNLNSNDEQEKVKVVVMKAPQPDQLVVQLSVSQGRNEKSVSDTTINVGGAPKGSDGKPLPFGSVLVPQITKTQALTPGEQVVLAKGAGAFPSLTVEVGG